jgi:hypothetical protein
LLFVWTYDFFQGAIAVPEVQELSQCLENV